MTNTTHIREAFAPTGVLRAVINLGNAVLAKAGKVNEEPTGVSVDLARKLAQQLDLELKLITVQKAADAVNFVATAKADIGFFAIDPDRASLIAFTEPYVLIQGAYLVPENSPLQQNDEVDKAGNRVVVGHGSAYDLYLSRHIKEAEIIRAPSSQEVVDLFLAHQYEVAAGVKQQLELDASRVGGVRMLPGHFMEIRQAMGVAQTRGPLVAAYLDQFVRHMKADGEVHRILDENKVQGAAVAD